MIIGVLQFELIVPASRSLKDKRRVVRSVRDRLHREHLVSVAEVGGLDLHRTAQMGVTMASNDVSYVQSVFDRILDKMRATPDARLGAVQREILNSEQLPTAFTGEDGSPLWAPDERRDPDEDAA